MAIASPNITRYEPLDPPTTVGDMAELRGYVYTELAKIGIALEMLADGQVEKSYAPPDKLNDGMVRYADGVTWNPGSGRGIYYYDQVGAAWRFLG